MADNDWKARLGMVYSTNPDFNYETTETPEAETLPPARQELRVWLDLPDGSFFTASWYEGDDFFPGGGTHNVNRPRFNLCDKGGKLKAGSKAESLLTDKLKELRKELLERGENHGA